MQKHHNLSDFHEDLLPLFSGLADVDDAVRVFGGYGSGVRYPVLDEGRWVLPVDGYGREVAVAALPAARRIAAVAEAVVRAA